MSEQIIELGCANAGSVRDVLERIQWANRNHQERLWFVRFMKAYQKRQREEGEEFNETGAGWSLYVELEMVYTRERIAEVYEAELARQLGVCDCGGPEYHQPHDAGRCLKDRPWMQLEKAWGR